MQHKTKGMALVDRVVRLLVEEYRPQKIFLFGSYAHGEPHGDSDLDLLIVKESDEERWNRRSRVQEIVKPVKRGVEVDVRVLTSSELHEELLNGNQFYQEVVFRGTLVYGEAEDYPMVEDSGPYARGWLSVALEDFQTAEFLLDQERSPNNAGMLLHQAVEKYLKAYLMFQGWRLERTHDLVALLEEATKHDPSFAQYRSVCETVTRYYVDDRYPERRRELTLEEVDASLNQIRPLVDRIIDTAEGAE